MTMEFHQGSSTFNLGWQRDRRIRFITIFTEA